MSHEDLNQIAESYDNKPVNLEKFVEYHRGEKSVNTIATYMRFLAQLDFDPDQQPEELENLHEEVRETARDKYGKNEDDRKKRKRFIYFTYLAVKDYIESLDNTDELKSRLPDSDKFEPVEPNADTESISEKQAHQIMEKADQQLEMAVLLGFHAGMRSIEVLNITPEWIEFKEERIEIEIPPRFAKSRKENDKSEFCFLDIEFEDKIKEFILSQHEEYEDYSNLYEHLSENGFEPLFDFKYGGKSDKGYIDLKKENRSLNYFLEKYAEKVGINNADDISFHSLRTSYIKNIHDVKGLNINKTQALARHKSAETTSTHYLGTKKQKQKEAHQEAYGNQD